MKFNRKNLGFTMIEMLATILVLLVILLIATPSIRKMLNKTNELSKEYVENIVIDAAKEYSSINNKSITDTLKLINDQKVISLDKLLNMGLIEQSDIDKLGPDARVLLTLKEDNYIDYKIVYDATLVTSNVSQLILLGENPTYVGRNETYLEPGYIGLDSKGNIITAKVTVTGTVDVTTLGTYTLTYKLIDDLGNEETQTRTVIVYDSMYPKVTIATSVSNNPYNNKYAKNGERITLNLTFSKIVTTPKVTIGGRVATVSGSGNTRTATLLIPADEATLINDELSIRVSEYKDVFDNVGEEQTNVTSGGLVVFDNIKPSITSTTIVSNNTNTKVAKNNETITMSTTFTEVVINTNPRISGRTPTISGSGTNVVTGTYLIPSTESTLIEGNLNPTIVSYMDRAGNIGDPSNIKLSGGTVVYDRTAPTCASSGGSSVWRNTDLTITGTCSDTGGSGCAGNVTKVLTATTSGTSPGTVSDNAGNTAVCANQVANIDKTAPTCVSSGGTSAWRNTDLTITGTCSDTGGSGCVGNVTKVLTTTTVGTSPGTVSDNAGNSTVCANQVANIDKTAPTCASSGGTSAWRNTDLTITGTCSDTGGSGCVGNVTKVLTATTAGTSPGTVSDNAGNTAVCANQVANIDKTAPTCASSGGTSAWRKTDLTITGTCSDTGGSGCTGNVSKVLTATTSGTSPGTVSDNAGNTAVCANQVANIDKTAPTCVSSGGTSAWRNTDLTITGTCSDTGGSGCTGNVTKVLTTTTVGTSPGTVSDNAGNSTVCANQVANIDKTAPTCASSGGTSAWRKTDLTITGTCSDTGGSGCTGNVTKVLTATTAGTSPGTVSDNAGNTAVCANQVANIDKAAPTCTVAKSNTGTTTGVTVTVTGSDTGGSGLASGTGTFTAITSTTTYTVKDNANNSGTCVASVSAVTQYRSSTCSAYCASSACTCKTYNTCSACGCATWGNYTRTINNVCSTCCTASGSAGTSQTYVTCTGITRYRYQCDWKCSGDVHGIVYSNYVYTTCSNAQSACTSLASCPSGYTKVITTNTCGSQAQQQKDTYTGTCTAYCASSACSCATYNTCSACGCTTWGTWSAWSSTVCSPNGNITQCQSQTLYN